MVRKSNQSQNSLKEKIIPTNSDPTGAHRFGNMLLNYIKQIKNRFTIKRPLKNIVEQSIIDDIVFYEFW